jgi:predicted enzyme related to lactoylglutathione lyase
MAHAVVHFEIGGPDEQQLADFYAGLLGWDMRPVPDIGYTLIDTRGGAGINGGVARRADGSAAVTFYVQADDLQAVLDKVNLLGGKTETPITELPGMATYAKFEDLDGLVLGLVLGPADPGRGAPAGSAAGTGAPGSSAPAPATPGQAVPGPSAGTGAPVDWFEVLASDCGETSRFLAEIFGWQAAADGSPYRMVDTGSDRGIRGGVGTGQHEDAGQREHWATVYARVPDVGAALARATELGGSREYGPMDVAEHMQTGAVRDPAGNVFGVYSRGPH